MNNNKDLKDFTFDELVNYCAEKILCNLMHGDFRSGVLFSVNAATQWGKNQNEKDKREK